MAELFVKTILKVLVCIARDLGSDLNPFILRSLTAIKKYSSEMLVLHDRLADLKSYFDGQKLGDSNMDHSILVCKHCLIHYL